MLPQQVSSFLHDGYKKARYGVAFLQNQLVHTNLQILYTCNFRCQICDFWKDPERYGSRITLDQARVIARQLNEIGPQIVSIGGGEPLLHPDIVEIVRTLARYHFPVMICNGWFLTPRMARDLFDAGMYEISVSVDYADAARHDEQRGVEGAYDRAIAALRIANENRRLPHQRVHMISVIMDDNLDHVEPLIRLCKEMGITYLVTLYSDSRGTKERRPAPRDVSSHLLALKKKYPEFVAVRGYLAQFSRAIAENGIPDCSCGKNLLNIDANGAVSPCIDTLERSVGNILTDDMKTLVDRLEHRNRTNECKGCWTSCRGTFETLMYSPDRLQNMLDYYHMTRAVPRPQ